MRRVEFLNHFDAGAAILGDLVDVGSLHQPHTDIGVTQAICCPRFIVSVTLELCALQNAVEEFDMASWKHGVCHVGLFERRRFDGKLR